jgi:hypothetical protein
MSKEGASLAEDPRFDSQRYRSFKQFRNVSNSPRGTDPL